MTRMFKSGWFNESFRHSLARRGISTNPYYAKKKQPLVDKTAKATYERMGATGGIEEVRTPLVEGGKTIGYMTEYKRQPVESGRLYSEVGLEAAERTKRKGLFRERVGKPYKYAGAERAVLGERPSSKDVAAVLVLRDKARKQGSETGVLLDAYDRSNQIEFRRKQLRQKKMEGTLTKEERREFRALKREYRELKPKVEAARAEIASVKSSISGGGRAKIYNPTKEEKEEIARIQQSKMPFKKKKELLLNIREKARKEGRVLSPIEAASKYQRGEARKSAGEEALLQRYLNELPGRGAVRTKKGARKPTRAERVEEGEVGAKMRGYAGGLIAADLQLRELKGAGVRKKDLLKPEERRQLRKTRSDIVSGAETYSEAEKTVKKLRAEAERNARAEARAKAKREKGVLEEALKKQAKEEGEYQELYNQTFSPKVRKHAKDLAFTRAAAQKKMRKAEEKQEESRIFTPEGTEYLARKW